MFKKNLKIWTQLVIMNFKHLLIYRAGFWITFALMAGWAAAYVIFVEVLFGHIGNLAGWNKAHVLLVLSFYYLFQNISDIFFKDNFEDFSDTMRKGELDFRLIKPASSRLLIFLYRMRFDQLSALIITIALFSYTLSQFDTPVSPVALAIGVFYMVFSTILYFSLLSIIATFAFWVQKNDTFRVLMWNVSQVARYPRQIYIGLTGKILTFVIPFAGLASIPAEIAVQFNTGYLPHFFVALTIVMLFISRWFWNFGLKKYSSAG